MNARCVSACVIVGLAYLAGVGAQLAAQVPRAGDETRILREAAARESRGDLDGAEVALRELLEVAPASSGGLFALERVLRAKGETIELLPIVDAFLARDASSSGVRYLKLRVLTEVDSLDALRREAEVWFALQPTSEVPFREVARVYERAFGAEAALAVLRKGRSAVGHPDALALEVGDVLAAMGDHEGAVDEWAVAVGPDGGQAATITRRVQGLTRRAHEAGLRLVEILAADNLLPRRRAAVRVAIDLGLETEALRISKRVAGELDGRARTSLLADVARRAREADLVEVASWAYDELGQDASNPAERRQFDQRIVDVALEAGDTATALDAQRRVAESFTKGSVDQRRATALIIRLEGANADPGRLVGLLGSFREDFPNAPELDDVAAAVAAALLARGDPGGAAAVLDGIEGPRSGIERAYLLMQAGEVETGRRALLLSVGGLDPADATDVIQLAGLLGRLSPEGGAMLAEARVEAHQGRARAAANGLAETIGDAPEEERAALLAEAARIADGGGESEVAAAVRGQLLAAYPEAPEVGEASIALARHHAVRPGGLSEAIRILEDIIVARPNAAVVPDARLELERLKRRQR